MASASNAGEQALRDAGGYGTNFAVGITGELSYSYVGLDLEGYFGLSSAKDTTVGSGVFGSTTESRAIHQIGINAVAFGHYPFKIGRRMWLRPKLGVGYGYVSTSLTADSETVSGEENNKAGGLIGMVGFEFVPAPKWYFGADFSMSIFASGRTDTVTNVSSDSVDASTVGFSRLRVGAYYEAFDHVLLGTQFSLRNLTLDTSSAVDERQMQILLTILYKL